MQCVLYRMTCNRCYFSQVLCLVSDFTTIKLAALQVSRKGGRLGYLGNYVIPGQVATNVMSEHERPKSCLDDVLVLFTEDV